MRAVELSPGARGLATAWAAIVALGITWYLRYSWKRGSVSIFGRSGEMPISRRTQPVWFWILFSFYGLIGVALGGGVLYRVYQAVSQRR